ncbi:AIM24 family protein [Lentzea sp. NBRC 102530]|uniref:AIM24 family protein n=1 Tax=Lentzea sp. NBRC 102530 TaxID=3032201 RepID=UPI0024A09991|nr:AIM24 family protein [Lentzea sp. NBRC 102530]GLY52053.1 TIGR00266 family protein [Lentzea sp. NBRC 102530]
MQVRTRHTPTFGVARLVLAPGEAVLVDPLTIAATSYGLAVEVKGAGSVAVALATAGAEGGWLDAAPVLPGDLHQVELDGSHGWCLARHSWIAQSSTVAMNPDAPPMQAIFGGAEGFMNYAHGQGVVVLACCGALDLVTLEAGEAVTISSDHVVAFADTLQCRLRPSVPDGVQSIQTGEGLVFDFAGPGAVLTQTRGPRRLTTWLRANGVSPRS